LPLNIYERAELAGRTNEYRSVYNMLCLNAHNNIQTLEYWHLQKMDNDDYIVVMSNRRKADLIPHLHAISGMLLMQTKALQDYFGTTEIDLGRYCEDQKKLNESIQDYLKQC